MYICLANVHTYVYKSISTSCVRDSYTPGPSAWRVESDLKLAFKLAYTIICPLPRHTIVSISQQGHASVLFTPVIISIRQRAAVLASSLCANRLSVRVWTDGLGQRGALAAKILLSLTAGHCTHLTPLCLCHVQNCTEKLSGQQYSKVNKV